MASYSDELVIAQKEVDKEIDKYKALGEKLSINSERFIITEIVRRAKASYIIKLAGEISLKIPDSQMFRATLDAVVREVFEQYPSIVPK